jgi:hypothetical protein
MPETLAKAGHYILAKFCHQTDNKGRATLRTEAYTGLGDQQCQREFANYIPADAHVAFLRWRQARLDQYPDHVVRFPLTNPPD